MHDPNSALFACYVLFIYFRGQNIARIEREMRALGYPRFHRRILYPRAGKPGWIARYDWTAALTGAASIPACESAPRVSDAAAEAETRPVGSVSPTAHRPRKQQLINALTENPKSQIQNLKFPAWLRTVSGNMTWSWRHQQVIIEQLERVTDGDCKRLMIFLPPRHGKSELVTVRYAAWRMQREPSMNVILGSYNQRLADRFSRKIRKVIADSEGMRAVESERRNEEEAGRGHAQTRPSNADPRDPDPALSRPRSAASPFPFVSTRPANSVSEWETTEGGGFRSVGVGSGVTGFGASLIVIDDPIKSRAEAESETYRRRVWDWFTDDLYTRLEPDGAIVLIQTRWHEDDLAGRLLREASDGGEPWDVINLPAIAEAAPESNRMRKMERVAAEEAISPECHPDHPVHPVETSVRLSHDWRPPGEPLCPERFDLTALKRIRRRLGEYSFSALYQQRPVPAGGGLFKREWFKKIVPFAPPGLKWKRAYDLAVSTRTSADYTASFRCAFDKEGNLYIAGGFRSRLEYPEQRRFIIDRIRNEPDTEHGIELALHGQALLQDLRREPGVRGYLLKGIRAENDKYTRALAWAPLAEEGKVILVRNASAADIPQPALRVPQSWIPDFIDEVCAFPSAAHDDQVDAVSLAVQMLKRPPRGGYGF